MSSSPLLSAARTTKASAILSATTSVLERQCACGQHTLGGAECESCRARNGEFNRKHAPGREVSAITWPGGSGGNRNSAGRFLHRGPLEWDSFSIKKTTEQHREPFRVSIRRETKEPSEGNLPATTGGAVSSSGNTLAHYDAKRGTAQPQDVSFAAMRTQTVVQAGPVQEPRPGETVRLPDIVLSAGIAQQDSINSTLTYNGSISRGGPTPAPFGETLPFNLTLSGINVTHAGSQFNVTATVDNPITFQVASGGDTDISSETDSDITQGNYPDVVRDLTPDMSDLNGRPPRDSFWAEDLCIEHERFHANEDLMYSRQGVAASQTWLNSQSAGNVAAVQSLLAQVPARVSSSTHTAMAFPAREERAYGAGAPAYLARANAIKTKGDAGDYPAQAGLSRGAKVGIGLAVGTAGGAGLGAIIGAIAGSSMPGVGAGAGAGYGAAIGAGIGFVGGLIGGLVA